MILSSLNDYYRRKSADPDSDIAREGWELKAIPFVLEIDEAGRLVQLKDMRTGTGKKKQAEPTLVPQGKKKTSGVAANLLWDSAEYVLGITRPGKGERKQSPAAAFREELLARFGPNPDDAGLAAVYAFLDTHRAEALERLAADGAWAEIVESNPIMTFKLLRDPYLVCQRPAVEAALDAPACGSAGPPGTCLVSGEADSIERVHPSIMGVWGAQTSGANIVSFNRPAFNSYAKDQSFNAPIGRRAVFGYTTALNTMLIKGSRQRIQVGDASTVFWAEKSSGTPFEALFLNMLDTNKDDPDANTQAVATLYGSVHAGRRFTEDDAQRFYVLGLAPNAARLSVRLWHVASISELGDNFARYFDELAIARPAYDTAPLSLLRLLCATALLGKAENIQPNLAGDVMQAILKGSPFPTTLLQGCMRRIRAEQEVTPLRAALLKAYLIRNHQKKEITVSLNPDITTPGYRLGRLFAALERTQELAQGNLNATIRERYYGAFSTTPVTVLPLLMKLKNHHLAKLDKPAFMERTIGEIVDGLGANIPARLTLADQAQFAVGYYHQRQAFFVKRESENNSISTNTDSGKDAA